MKFLYVFDGHNFCDWKSNDKIISKELYYTDPYYSFKLNKIFGYGGYCHYRVSFHDEKSRANTVVNLFCFRTERNRNTFLLIAYWILVQVMFIASLWKEIILLVSFMISLFFKYGLIYLHKNCWTKYFKNNSSNSNNNDIEYPLSSV